MKKVDLFLIDAQEDFCNPQGALFVPGAAEDMERVAAMIRRLGGRINDIHATLDQHHLMDVAHPAMWKGADGKHPAPFTIITVKDVEGGTWTPCMPSLTRKMLAYVKGLETGGRYPLCIWPPHCLIGSQGAALVPSISEALNGWVEAEPGTIDFVSKGSNPFTEHYSGVKAEVPDPSDPSTQLNMRLIQALENADEILIAGEAGSHCTANTVRDVAAAFSNAEYVKKFTLLTDGVSPVPGFEKLQEQFIADMTALGMKLSTTVDVLK
jgi:nicotinamidase-related amidase